MKKKLFFYISFLLFAAISICFAVSVYITHKNNFGIAKDVAVETARIYADFYTKDTNITSFVKAGDETRVTIVSSNGKVLADSSQIDITTLENHLNRPEIQAAANLNPQTYIRYSETLGVDLIYYALKTDIEGNFVRVAVPVKKVETYIFQTLTMLVLLFFSVALLCFIFIDKMVNKITKPLGTIEQKLRSLVGEESNSNAVQKNEEIQKIMQDIDKIATVLQNSFQSLKEEKNKISYILDNINDGLFVVNGSKDIVLINSAAMKIFNSKSEVLNKNLSYLCYDKVITSAIDECINSGKAALFEMAFGGHIYFTAVNRLPKTELIMVVLTDVTEMRESAKRREEFFANASHELKTPLTAIKGFNELNAIANKDENIQKYIKGIERETNRMLSLIADMLKLSELESAQEIKPVPISLAKIAEEAQECMLSAIKEKNISFELSGYAEVLAEREHVYELTKNLIENAVRYSNANGSVVVKIEESESKAKLIVYDDGIGISSEEQTRIFERFYRVEKSRSQKNEGTGLGLAIVKHICILYGWKISLKSKPGMGTEVIVIFEKKI